MLKLQSVHYEEDTQTSYIFCRSFTYAIQCVTLKVKHSNEYRFVLSLKLRNLVCYEINYFDKYKQLTRSYVQLTHG